MSRPVQGVDEGNLHPDGNGSSCLFQALLKGKGSVFQVLI